MSTPNRTRPRQPRVDRTRQHPFDVTAVSLVWFLVILIAVSATARPEIAAAGVLGWYVYVYWSLREKKQDR